MGTCWPCCNQDHAGEETRANKRNEHRRNQRNGGGGPAPEQDIQQPLLQENRVRDGPNYHSSSSDVQHNNLNNQDAGRIDELTQTIEVESEPEEQQNATKSFNVFIIGEVGEGKSSLSLALTESKSAKVANIAGGVTKEVEKHKILPEFIENAYLFDGPGIGDHDVSLDTILKNLADTCRDHDVHCIIMCIGMLKGRVTLGARVCLLMLQQGFISSYDHIIICGTKRDILDEDSDIEDWEDIIGGHTGDKWFGGRSNLGGICSVGLKMKRKKDNRSEFEVAEKDVDDLIKAMRSVKDKGKAAKYERKGDLSQLFTEAGQNRQMLNIDLNDKEIESMKKWAADLEKSQKK